MLSKTLFTVVEKRWLNNKPNGSFDIVSPYFFRAVSTFFHCGFEDQYKLGAQAAFPTGRGWNHGEWLSRK